MSQTIFAANTSSGSKLSLSNTGRLKVVYTKTSKATPKIGENVPLSDLIPITETLTIKAKVLEGDVQIMTDFPLLILAQIYASKNKMVQTSSTANNITGGEKGTITVNTVTFYVDLCEVTRILGGGQNIEYTVSCSAGTVEIIGCEAAQASKIVPFYQYLSGKIIAQDTANIACAPIVVIPSASDKFVNIELSDDQTAVMTVDDIEAIYDDEFVSYLQQGLTSEWLTLNLSQYPTAKIKSGTENMPYYFRK